MADKVAAELRTDFGKGASRQLRRSGRVPAVIYGHGSEPVHVSFDTHEVFLATKGQANPIFTIVVEGKSQLVLVKELQRNPLTRNFEHLDLLRVATGEKVDVEVPVEVTGETAPGTIHTIELMNVLVKAPATDIPESVVVDVEGREDGQHVTVADLNFAPGVESDLDPEAIVVVISQEHTGGAAEVEAAGDEGEATEAASED
ncbi:MAG: 50S ribosomal protein L25/general stress protein Ctc [Actinomycetaceae bacterium]|nr:50S ribosomal protein L25/general stress protein Ctc [Actinomycetaceae bacterium]